MQLLLGNSAAIEPQVGTAHTTADEEATSADPPKKIPGDQVLTIEVPASRPLDEALTEVKAIWRLHSEAEKPDWVEGDTDLLVQAVASTFAIPVGRPNSEEETVDEG